MTVFDPIESFVLHYLREYDFYYEVARLVSQECDALAAENGIKAIVTFRAKSPDRLKSKLLQRNLERSYQSEEEIRADIVDLSGVRIALYFPGDRSKIGSLLKAAFTVDQEKTFPDKRKAANQRFDGYHAEHYRVRLKPLSEAQQRYGNSLVEIQVASVLMHAWSEVEHDLNYKQLSGQISPEEQAILDGINGIILSGEVFLERLQAAFEARVSRTETIFANQYELAAFLYDWFKGPEIIDGQPNEPLMGRIDILFRLLHRAGVANPKDLRLYLQDISPEAERRPLADQIIDRVLASRSDLYEQYIEMRRAGGGAARTFFTGHDQPSPETVGDFLHKWIILERFTRRVAIARRALSRGATFQALGIPEAFKTQLAVLRRIRNNLVHGITIPTEELLSSAARDLEELLEKLTSSEDPDIREAMRWARSDESDPPEPTITEL